MAEILVLSTHNRIDFALHGVWRGRHFRPLPARTWPMTWYAIFTGSAKSSNLIRGNPGG